MLPHIKEEFEHDRGLVFIPYYEGEEQDQKLEELAKLWTNEQIAIITSCPKKVGYYLSDFLKKKVLPKYKILGLSEKINNCRVWAKLIGGTYPTLDFEPKKDFLFFDFAGEFSVENFIRELVSFLGEIRNRNEKITIELINRFTDEFFQI